MSFKNINKPIVSMNYLEVIDWIIDRSEACANEVESTTKFFEYETGNNDEIKYKVKSRVKEIIEHKK